MNDRDTIISNMLKAATVENERLRSALKPFANQAKEWADCAAHDKVLVMLCKPTWNDPEKIQESPQVGAITMGDFRRAIAALASEQKVDKGD